MGKLSLTNPHVSPRADAEDGPYQTQLSPEREQVFRSLLQLNAAQDEPPIPALASFNPDDPRSDYDARGWFEAATDPAHPWHELAFQKDEDTGHPTPHLVDWWKTPYHPGFSAESRWAKPGMAPLWTDDGKGGWNLMDRQGSVVKAEPAEGGR